MRIYEAYLSDEDGDEAYVIDDDDDEEDAYVGDDVHDVGFISCRGKY